MRCMIRSGGGGDFSHFLLALRTLFSSEERSPFSVHTPTSCIEANYLLPLIIYGQFRQPTSRTQHFDGAVGAAPAEGP